MYEVDILPKIGDIIKDRYKIVLKISQGEKRIIFSAFDQQMQQIAVKLEQDTDGETTICVESAILKILANSNHIPRFFSYGQHKNCKFMAYELLGPNLIDLVNYKRPYKFSLHYVLKFGIQAIETLQIVHNKDFIYRNIKPGNFLIGNTQGTFGTFYLVGFELCKKINKHHGVVTTPTNKANFRGTMMYSSLNAHNLVELGRNDDLISLFYILVEFYNGMLPWSDVDEQKVQALKEYFHGRKLLQRLPKQFLEFESYILSLDYTTDPDYTYLISLLIQAAEENEINLNDPFEWEEEINEERSNITKHHISSSMIINKSIQQLEQKKQQIEQENNENKTEQIEQVDKEIDQLNQQILSIHQLNLKLNSLNIIHRLQKKQQLKNQELELQDIQDNIQDQNALNEIKPSNLISHIHPVKSYHNNNELTNSYLITPNSSQTQLSPFGGQSFSYKRNNNNSSRSKTRRPSNLSLQSSIQQTNTLHEFIEVLDALTGIKSDDDFNPFENNNRSESQSLIRQENFIEQFIDGMKKKDDKYNQFDWASFAEQTGVSHQNEGFDGIDVSERDDPLSETTTQSSLMQQFLSLMNLNGTSLLKSQSDSLIYESINSPPIVEYCQPSSLQNLIQQNNTSSSNANIERKLSTSHLQSDLKLNDQVINNDISTQQTQDIPLTNLKHNQNQQQQVYETKKKEPSFIIQTQPINYGQIELHYNNNNQNIIDKYQNSDEQILSPNSIRLKDEGSKTSTTQHSKDKENSVQLQLTYLTCEFQVDISHSNTQKDIKSLIQENNSIQEIGSSNILISTSPNQQQQQQFTYSPSAEFTIEKTQSNQKDYQIKQSLQIINNNNSIGFDSLNSSPQKQSKIQLVDKQTQHSKDVWEIDIETNENNLNINQEKEKQQQQQQQESDEKENEKQNQCNFINNNNIISIQSVQQQDNNQFEQKDVMKDIQVQNQIIQDIYNQSNNSKHTPSQDNHRNNSSLLINNKGCCNIL